MPIKTRKSILAVNEQVTAGVPVLADASGDFSVLREGFSMAPETDLLESDELRDSLGTPKPALGIERGTASIPKYLKHSGVEGQKPDYSEMLKSAFGAEDVEGTEYDTVASSTTTEIKVDTGEGVNFRRGQGLLIKSVPYSLRAVQSIATDDLELNFKLSGAPASGVNLGKCVGYYPSDDNTTILTLDLFRGNGGMREVLADAKVTTLDMVVNAGEYIEGNFEFQGTKYYFDPINVTGVSNNNDLDFYDGTNVMTATIEAKVYRDPHEFAAALQAAMNTATNVVDSYTVVYNDYGSDKGKFTLTSDGSTFELRFGSGPNTPGMAAILGFTATNKTGALTYTSNNVQSWASAFSTDFDDADPLVAKAGEIFMGGQNDNFNVCVETMNATLTNTVTENLCTSAETGVDSVEVTNRVLEVTFTATADQHDARLFKYYRTGESVQFMFNFGEKSGGNWVPGTCVQLYVPNATVLEFTPDDADGKAVFNVTLQAFVQEGGQGEVFLNLL